MLIINIIIHQTRSHDNSLNYESREESSTSMNDEESGLENLTEDSESIGDQEGILEGNFGDVVIDEASEATNAAGSGSSGSPPSADDQNESSGARDNIKEEILACILRGLILAEEMTSSVTDIEKLLKYAKDLLQRGLQLQKVSVL